MIEEANQKGEAESRAEGDQSDDLDKKQCGSHEESRPVSTTSFNLGGQKLAGLVPSGNMCLNSFEPVFYLYFKEDDSKPSPEVDLVDICFNENRNMERKQVSPDFLSSYMIKVSKDF